MTSAIVGFIITIDNIFAVIPLSKREEKSALGDLFKTLKEAFTSEEASTRGILTAIFSWFFGYNAVETFFTSYGKWYLGIKENEAAFILGYLALVFIIPAIPAGFIASKIGRKRS